MSEKKEDFTNLSNLDLKERIVEAKKQLLSLRFRKKSGELKDVSVFRKTKKMIAKLFTILNRRGCDNGSK
ncbi:MAG: 50S ribosomal protein L29 [Rickettsiales bacterium]|nr:50S ribosomal protein L29 [Rickettsiales bacterium]